MQILLYPLSCLLKTLFDNGSDLAHWLEPRVMNRPATLVVPVAPARRKAPDDRHPVIHIRSLNLSRHRMTFLPWRHLLLFSLLFLFLAASTIYYGRSEHLATCLKLLQAAAEAKSRTNQQLVT